MGQLVDSLTFKTDKLPPELAQAIARIFIAGLFFAALLLYYFLFGNQNSATVLCIGISFFYGLCSYLYMWWIIRSDQFQSIRRFITLFVDISVVCSGVYLFSGAGYIFYPTLLWISIAYGIRYGLRFLYLSTVISSLAFTVTLYLSGILLNNPEVSLALIFGLIALPSLFALMVFQKERITRAYQQQLNKNHYLMTHDALTNLPNRVLIEEIIDIEIANAKRGDYGISVAYLDIDDFNKINDSLGHKSGDELIMAVAKNIRTVLRESDYLARLSGDDFLVVLKNQKNTLYDIVVIERLIERISGNYRLNNEQVFINISIGISQFPFDADSVQNLIMHADTAMFQAKKHSGSSYRFYEQTMSSTLKHDLSIQTDLRHALENNEFYLVYQPQLSLFSGKITGVEALIRWRHPQHGEIPPDRFIPYAERMGLIDEIGEWVLHTAIKQNRLWQQAGLQEIVMAVNLSGHQIHNPELGGYIQNLLKSYQMEPQYLELEVTESMLLDNVELASKVLNGFKECGIPLAMDDFGTGYSSLATLHRFPFDKLKIDRAFVSNIIQDPEQAEIAKTIIAMGHALKMNVIAEGVETEAQAHYLQRHHCDAIQGYLFSKPLLAEDFAVILTKDQTPSWMFTFLDSLHTPAILIVDDDKIALKAMRSTLEKLSTVIYSASNTSDAFDLLSNHQIDVLLTDNQMPDMLGIDFLARVKTLYPDIIRMLITGNADATTAQDAVNRGAVYKFLSKKTSADELVSTMNEAINLYQYQSVNQKYYN